MFQTPLVLLITAVAVVVTSCATAERGAQPTPEQANDESTPQADPLDAEAAPPPPATRPTLSQEAVALAPLYSAEVVSRFLSAVASLPAVDPMRIACPSDGGTCAEAGATDEARVGWTVKTYDEAYFYTTRFGSPLSYARPLQVLSDAGVTTLQGKKVLDFGYGYIGHLMLFADLGADVHGIEVDPVLPVLYRNHTGPRGEGQITLHHGHFPAEGALVDEVGTGYDLIVSKNVLKRGYIHPEREAPAKWLIDLGVTDEVFLGRVFAALAPGGTFMIYNIAPRPAPADQPYIPWADGRSPFSSDAFVAAGFEVKAFDVVDDAPMRAMADAMDWDSDMALADLFAHYTLVVRPAE